MSNIRPDPQSSANYRKSIKNGLPADTSGWIFQEKRDFTDDVKLSQPFSILAETSSQPASRAS